MEKKITNPTKVIRAHCLDCCNGSQKEVEGCTVEKCFLHPWRFGKNPYREKRILSEDQKTEMRDRLKKARELKRP